MTTHAPVRILTVCAGNICRSPYAQLYLQRGLDSLSPGDFCVRSAGTEAMPASPIHPLTRRHLQAEGIATGSFQASEITETELLAADVVLTMTVEQRHAVVGINPRMLKRTFTLLEFAALLPTTDGNADIACGSDLDTVRQRWAVLPKILSGVRSGLKKQPLDVADPYRRGEQAFVDMVAVMQPALQTVITYESRWRVEPSTHHRL